jgi:D-amino-acid oxidase
MMRRRRQISVIGAGVSGLTSAIVLAERGYDVTLFAAEMSITTSAVASAIWYPYHIGPKETVERWGRTSCREFVLLAANRGSGVALIVFRVFSIKSLRLL